MSNTIDENVDKNRKYLPTKDCKCEDWKNNMPKLNGCIQNACLHHSTYDAEYFRFCPWCGYKLDLKP